MRTVTTVAEVATPQTPFIRLRGKWLEQYGFKPGSTVYIDETEAGLILSAKPPELTTTLEAIKLRYAELGISTERKNQK